MSEKLTPHGSIVTRDFNGYSIYTCGNCGKNINMPGCGGKKP